MKQLEEARKKAEDKATKAMESAIVAMKKGKDFHGGLVGRRGPD